MNYLPFPYAPCTNRLEFLSDLDFLVAESVQISLTSSFKLFNQVSKCRRRPVCSVYRISNDTHVSMFGITTFVILFNFKTSCALIKNEAFVITSLFKPNRFFAVTSFPITTNILHPKIDWFQIQIVKYF